MFPDNLSLQTTNMHLFSIFRDYLAYVEDICVYPRNDRPSKYAFVRFVSQSTIVMKPPASYIFENVAVFCPDEPYIQVSMKKLDAQSGTRANGTCVFWIFNAAAMAAAAAATTASRNPSESISELF